MFLLRARRDIPLPPVSQLQRLGSEDEEEDCGGFFGMTRHSLKSAGGNEGSATLQTLSAIAENALRVDPSSGATTLTTLRVRGVGLSTMLDFNPGRHTVRDLFLRVRSELFD